MKRKYWKKAEFSHLQ